MDGKLIAPQVVDQPVRRHRPPEMDEEVGQQGPDLGLGHLDQPAVRCPCGQGAEQPETHQVRITRPRADSRSTGARGRVEAVDVAIIRRPGRLSGPPGQILAQAARQAFVQGLHVAFAVSAAAMLGAAVLAAIQLRRL
jgi:hypothetical protein